MANEKQVQAQANVAAKPARDLTEFASFAKKAVRVPQQNGSYRSSYGRSYSRISSDFTKDEIRQIIESGDPEAIRELSKYYNRFSGTYTRPLQYYATLLNYGYVIVPHYDIDSRPKKMKPMYKKISKYVKDMHLEYILPKINLTVLTEGIYYGLLIEDENEKPTFYKLPARYCRSRFLDADGLPILELSLSYFDSITNNEAERKQILKLFPKYVQALYGSKKHKDLWTEIPASEGGLCFFFTDDQTPPFVSATMSANELESAREREAKRDENALRKILIHKLPINKNDGELLFTLPEAELLHESVCNMLADDDSIDVITTYADINLESVQDEEASANSSSSRIEKYLNNVYDDLGAPSAIFNAGDGTTALTFSIKKDISLMFAWSHQYELAINSFLKRKAKNEALYFSIKLLPTSSIFRKEDVDMYLKTAQYGYPKSTVASIIGLDIVDLAQIIDFENNILHLEEAMVPLMSSYTSSGKEEKSSTGEKKSVKQTTSPNLTDEGGRPQKSTEERSDKTDRNIEGST